MDAYLPLSSVNVGHYCLVRRSDFSFSEQRVPWIFEQGLLFALFVTSLSGGRVCSTVLEYKCKIFYLSLHF